MAARRKRVDFRPDARATDLILGYVVDAGYEETGVAKFALLEPAVELGSLEQIFVLMAFDTDSE